MTTPMAHIPMPELLYKLQRTLSMTQKQLADLVGCSSRTIIRYYKGGGFFLPQTYATLAKACLPHDASLAAYLAAHAGMTLEQIGGRPPAPPPLPAPALPPPRPLASAALLADSVVCAAAEAMQCTPQAMRPALAAALERIVALGLTADEALQGLASPADAGARKAKAARAP